jgi:hypothetical protein
MECWKNGMLEKWNDGIEEVKVEVKVEVEVEGNGIYLLKEGKRRHGLNSK